MKRYRPVVSSLRAGDVEAVWCIALRLHRHHSAAKAAWKALGVWGVEGVASVSISPIVIWGATEIIVAVLSHRVMIEIPKTVLCQHANPIRTRSFDDQIVRWSQSPIVPPRTPSR